MLAKRFVTGLSLAAVFVAVLVLDEQFAPWYPFWFLLSLVALGKAAIELVGLLNRTSAQPSGNTVIGGVLALTVADWVPHILREVHPDPMGVELPGWVEPATVLAWPAWAFLAVLMLTFVVQSVQFETPGRTMATVSATVLAVGYIGLLGSCIIQIRWLGGRYEGLMLLAALVATAKGSDIGAYTLGRLTGRHKLWPVLSPNKTIEGAVGGLVFGVLGALLVEILSSIVLQRHHLMGWAGATGFGLLVGTSAQLGDLMESMIKRDCTQKDAGDTLPGFGGALDVLDSLLFAGPVAYGYWLCTSL